MSAHAIEVSGTAVRDDQYAAWQECDGVTQNVAIAVDTTQVATVACDSATGAFSATGITVPAADRVVVAYFDGAATRGAAYTISRDTTSDIVGLLPMQNDVSVRHERPASTVNTLALAAFDVSRDPDVPFDATTEPARTPVGFGIHVRGDATFGPGGGIVTDAFDVMPGAKLTTPSARAFEVRGNGTQGCMHGVGVQRPICIRSGGTFVSTGDQWTTYSGTGTFVVAALDYSQLRIWGGPNSLAILGSGPGQTLRSDVSMDIASPVTSDPWAPDVDVGWFSYGGRTGIEVSSTWRGSQPFQITVGSRMTGGGIVDLEGADVTLKTMFPTQDFGNTGNNVNNWQLRSLRIEGAYERSAQGTGAGAGMLTPPGTPAFDADAAIAWERSTDVVGYAWGTDDIALVRYKWAGGLRVPDDDWDDQDANSTDDDGDAVLVLDNAGAVDVAHGLVATSNSSCAGGTSLVVYGSSNGDLAAWSVCASHGLWDSSFDEDGRFLLDAGGATDRIVSMERPTATTINVYGSGGAAESMLIRHVDLASDTVTASADWQYAGQPTEAFAVCTGSGSSRWFVGRTGSSGSQDWVAKRTTDDRTSWDVQQHTWDAGSGTERARACSWTGARLLVGGELHNGSDLDARIIALNGGGALDTSWSTGGVHEINGVGDDVIHDVLSVSGQLMVAGMTGANGGTFSVRRLTANGHLDGYFGEDGVASWDSTPGVESASAIASIGSSPSTAYAVVGTTDVGGGDPVVRFYDQHGDVLDAVEPGRSRIHLRGTTVRMAHDVTIGAASGSAYEVQLDLDVFDSALAMDGALQVADGSALLMPRTRAVTVGGDLALDGRVQGAHSGELLLRGSEPAHVRTNPQVSFESLSIVGQDKEVRIDPSSALTVRSALTIRGTSCSMPVRLRSSAPGVPATLALATGGSASLDNIDVTDVAAAPTPLLSTAGNGSGIVTGWTLSGCAPPATSAPALLEVDGARNPLNVETDAPTFSWVNHHAPDAERTDVELYSSPLEDQVALWRFDGDGLDAGGTGHDLTASGGVTHGVMGRFTQAARIGSTSGDQLAAASDPAFDLDAFTIDGWIKLDGSGTAPYHTIVERCGATCNFRLRVVNATDTLQAYVRTASGSDVTASAPFGAFQDGTWHHVGFTWDGMRLRLFVDGTLRSTSIPPSGGALAHPGAPILVGSTLGGDIDDLRIVPRAVSFAELRGYVRTNRPHADKVWDLDPSDSVGSAIGTTIGPGGRFQLPYGGSADLLAIDGARWWVRTRVLSSTSTWSSWSRSDWFDSGAGISISMDTEHVSMSVVNAVASNNASATGSLTVTSRTRNGYTVTATGPTDAWALSDGIPGGRTVAGWGSNTTPAAWPETMDNGFAMSVLAASDGKDTTRWGSGSTPTDYAGVNWAWAGSSTPLHLLTTTGASPGANTILLGYRVRADASVPPASYVTSISFTVTPNV